MNNRVIKSDDVYMCGCGVRVSSRNCKKHEGSLKHINYLNTLPDKKIDFVYHTSDHIGKYVEEHIIGHKFVEVVDCEDSSHDEEVYLFNDYVNRKRGYN